MRNAKVRRLGTLPRPLHARFVICLCIVVTIAGACSPSTGGGASAGDRGVQLGIVVASSCELPIDILVTIEGVSSTFAVVPQAGSPAPTPYQAVARLPGRLGDTFEIEATHRCRTVETVRISAYRDTGASVSYIGTSLDASAVNATARYAGRL